MFELIKSDHDRYCDLRGSRRSHVLSALLFSATNPRLLPVMLTRFASALHNHGLSCLGKLVSTLNLMTFGLEVASQTRIGPGLFLPHPVGTVIGAESLGRNVTVFQGVTLGARELDMHFTPGTRPVIGDDVTIGAGAKILGGVNVGSGARIGANAVVLADVPAGRVAVGIPARILDDQ